MADCTTQPLVSEIVARADELYEANQMREGLSYLKQYAHLDEVEVTLLALDYAYNHPLSVGVMATGAALLQGREVPDGVQEEKKRLAGEGWSYIERALAAGGDRHNGCRRWAGILLSWSSEFEGIKKKIEKGFEIRDHFLSAIECDAKDATSMHLLGQWCYSVVSVPWYQRQVASVFFATPPQSTYQEALSYFEAAEKADPGFYMVNWLWIGKCHLALGKREEAEPWLEKTAKKEAAELLKKL
ncbi:Regulator of microtubule dynamics protein 1 [Geodia barretti]|uniref:Regulator of microtubule dynamics protein 1 n=1 Tax=Geodia barretti TaxID=519541 RepID=A0AA35RPV7_GEOBA|nr:Regulator of microtubule dynamics protein 1 [Geodia barretti]